MKTENWHKEVKNLLNLYEEYIKEGNTVPNLSDKDEKKLLRATGFQKFLDRKGYQKTISKINDIRKSEDESEIKNLKKLKPGSKKLDQPFKFGDHIGNGKISGKVVGPGRKKKVGMPGERGFIDGARGFISVDLDEIYYTGEGKLYEIIYVKHWFRDRKEYEETKKEGLSIDQWKKVPMPKAP
jgi:hypothetical protein